MLNKEELDKISEAIRLAESQTSGEIRVCIAKRCPDNPLDAALAKFHQLKMEETALRNSVLIYVAPHDQKAAIIGDSGIDKIAVDGFWDNVLSEMLSYFKKGLIVEGLYQGVGKVGELIKASYPIADNDINELSDEVIVEE